MKFQLFDHPRVRQLLTIALLSGTLLCIFPPMQPAFQWWADQAFYIALGYLLFGLFFLVVDKPRLMFVCFGCSAAICFFKNEVPPVSSNQSFLLVPPIEMEWQPRGSGKNADHYRIPETASSLTYEY
jgi:hypothetical protein